MDELRVAAIVPINCGTSKTARTACRPAHRSGAPPAK